MLVHLNAWAMLFAHHLQGLVLRDPPGVGGCLHADRAVSHTSASQIHACLLLRSVGRTPYSWCLAALMHLLVCAQVPSHPHSSHPVA